MYAACLTSSDLMEMRPQSADAPEQWLRDLIGVCENNHAGQLLPESMKT